MPQRMTEEEIEELQAGVTPGGFGGPGAFKSLASCKSRVRQQKSAGVPYSTVVKRIILGTKVWHKGEPRYEKLGTQCHNYAKKLYGRTDNPTKRRSNKTSKKTKRKTPKRKAPKRKAPKRKTPKTKTTKRKAPKRKTARRRSPKPKTLLERVAPRLAKRVKARRGTGIRQRRLRQT